MEHFGVIVKPGKYGLKLNRETYAIINNRNSLGKFPSVGDWYADPEGKYYTDEWCQKHRKDCLENFDLSMRFFASLSHEEFNEEIDKFLKANKKFKEVSDLKEYDGEPGYYLMILDEYCQIYVGTSHDIKRRIQQHWTQTKSFDRLLFPIGAVTKSVLSIDVFRALDTTRIFAYRTDTMYEHEDSFINQFPQKFISNRIGGGRLEAGPLGFLQALGTRKSKELSELS